MRALRPLLIMGLALVAQAASAQQQPRLVTASASAPWKHGLTNLVLPAEAAGLVRGEIRDSTAGELDVFTPYVDPARETLAMVYVYRTGVPDVAIWFDRAAWGMRSAPGHGLNDAAVPPPSPFARPGASAPSGLRLAMDVPGPGFKSTALAIAPLGSWLVKVQMSSMRLSGAELDAKLDAVLAALGWPAEIGTPRAAAAILPCTGPLSTKQARVVRDDMTQMLMNSVAGAALEGDGPPPVYCREPGLPPELGVYRADASANAYVVAMNDSGIALSVGPALSLDALMGVGRSKRYSMVMLQRNGTSVLPSFNRLPPPAQAISVARGSTPTLSTTTRVEAPR
jgi:hypothetical protein